MAGEMTKGRNDGGAPSGIVRCCDSSQNFVIRLDQATLYPFRSGPCSANKALT